MVARNQKRLRRPRLIDWQSDGDDASGGLCAFACTGYEVRVTERVCVHSVYTPMDRVFGVFPRTGQIIFGWRGE